MVMENAAQTYLISFWLTSCEADCQNIEFNVWNISLTAIVGIYSGPKNG